MSGAIGSVHLCLEDGQAWAKTCRQLRLTLTDGTYSNARAEIPAMVTLPGGLFFFLAP